MKQEQIALYAFQKFGDAALQLAFCCIGNCADAEDIAQEVFFALHRSPRSFSDDEALCGYLAGEVVRRCADRHKHLTQRIREGMDNLSPLRLTGKDDKTKDILNRVTALPQPYAEVVCLHDALGMHVRQIAAVLERSTETVSAQLQTGRERLGLPDESGVAAGEEVAL